MLVYSASDLIFAIYLLTKYTKILEVNLFAFAYRLFHEDFSSIIGAFCIRTHSLFQLYMYFKLIGRVL